MKKFIKVALLCFCTVIMCLTSCGDDDEKQSGLGGCKFTIDDVRSIVVPGVYIRDTSNVICTKMFYCGFLPSNPCHMVGGKGERYCIFFENTFEAQRRFLDGFVYGYAYEDTFELDAKLYEYAYDTIPLQHQVVEERHRHWIEPLEGVDMYTVKTTEMSLWHLKDGKKELVEF